MTDLTKKALGQRIRTIRTRLRATQEELARMLTTPLTGAGISAYENGDAWPPLPVFNDLCRIGGVTFKWLMTGDEAEEGPITPEQEEERLLQAFRDLGPQARRALITLAESSVSGRKKG